VSIVNSAPSSQGSHLTIAIDQRPIANAHGRRGIGRYVRGLFGDIESSSTILRLTERRSWGFPRVSVQGDAIVTHLPPRPNIALDPLPARAVRRHLERRPLGLTHLSDPYLVEWAPRHCPLVVTIYDFIQYGQRGRIPDRFNRGLRSALARPDVHFTTISHSSARGLRDLGVSPERVTVLFPGPTSWPSAISPLGFEGALVIGALDDHKRPGHALEAAKEADIDILFAGRHEARLIERWRLDAAQVASDVSDATLAQHIRDARCVIHASMVEGFGLPVLEALALGTPVAAYDLPVTREIVGPEYPLAPQEAGPSGLAELIRAFADPHARREAVASATPHLLEFNWATTARRRDALYAKILKEGPT